MLLPTSDPLRSSLIYARVSRGRTCGVGGLTKSDSPDAAGVDGQANIGTAAGVRGRTFSTAPGATGVRGQATKTTGRTYGVSGETASAASGASGVFGEATGTSGGTSGVRGETHSGAWEAAGVLGKNLGTQGHGTGVRGEVETGIAGVMGYAKTLGHGVWGSTTSTSFESAGVYGLGNTTDSKCLGVYGQTFSSQGVGVRGRVEHPTGNTVGVHGVSASLDGIGVVGETTTDSTAGTPVGVKGVAVTGTGVMGVTSSDTGTAIHALCTSTAGTGTALRAQVSGIGGTAILAEVPVGGVGRALRVKGPSLFESDLDIDASVDIRDFLTVRGLTVTQSSTFSGLQVEGPLLVSGYASFPGGHGPHGGDVAEHLRAEKVEAGDVVVIGADGKLAPCSEEADTAVAGIVSTDPTVSVGNLQAGGGTAPLALVGVVPCKVDATKSPIKPGDLLVSSTTPGHAMKCTSKRPAAGTVIGKALEGLEKGTGVIQVLVTLR
jgi:hypothetical protein